MKGFAFFICKIAEVWPRNRITDSKSHDSEASVLKLVRPFDEEFLQRCRWSLPNRSFVAEEGHGGAVFQLGEGGKYRKRASLSIA